MDSVQQGLGSDALAGTGASEGPACQYPLPPIQKSIGSGSRDRRNKVMMFWRIAGQLERLDNARRSSHYDARIVL